MASSDLGTYQMLWDCENCDTQRLLGLNHRHCPACGSPQDPERRYFPTEDNKVAVEDHELTGADRSCPACETPNAAKADFCGGCGSPLDESEGVAVRGEQTSSADGDFADDSAGAAESEHASADESPSASAPPSSEDSGGQGRKGGLFAGAAGMLVIGAIILCCALGGVFFFWKKDASFTVEGHSWTRTIEVEKLDEVSKSAWKDEVPSSADNVSCKKAERSTKEEPDGENCVTKRKDNGDGTFTEREECTTKYKKVPVYDQKCSYTVEDWVVTRTEKADGKGLKPAPSWPSVKLKDKGRRLGSEREGDRKESYDVHFTGSDGASHSCDWSESNWKAAAEGSTWTGQVGVMSGAIDCGSLKPG